MKKASLVVSDYLKKNSIFDETGIHRDDIFDRFIQLKNEFKKHGYDLATHDINTIEESVVVIYASNMPKVLPKDIEKSYIILSESEFIRPDNYDKNLHKYFKRIFTWHDELVNGEKYIKLNYAHKFPNEINSSFDRALCHLIAGNKKPPNSPENDLYSKREEAIRWFEKNQPNDFDLYGVGWDTYAFSSSRLNRFVKKHPLLKRLINKTIFKEYPSYKGMVDNKKHAAEKYKFSICYENAKDIPGYITEKIFDSFFAGCIPVYWGPKNIHDHIPKECFIDKRRYSSFEELYAYLSNMTESEYLEYISAINNFLCSKKAQQFSSYGFANTIVNTVLGDMHDS